MKLWTTASRGVRRCRWHSASATVSTSRRSKPFSANGCAGYRIPSVLKTAGQVTEPTRIGWRVMDANRRIGVEELENPFSFMCTQVVDHDVNLFPRRLAGHDLA